MYCPKCGKKQENGVEYCPECGVSIKSGYTNEDKKEIKIDIIKKILTFIICFGYGLFFNIIGFVLYIILKKKEAKGSTGVLIGTLASIALVTYIVVKKILM
ncbi:MAG: zinc ribbon domain-containing protein [Bacilli bacterium]|nr:zinc ribbon domain-containing protein [Bacilli bacterium]